MANLGNLIVRGVTRILGDAYANKFIGNLQGNADTATSAIKASTADSATSATSANKASIATAVQDYGTSDYREIKIGYNGSGLSSSDITHAVGFTDSGTKIKDISKDEFRNWLATASGTWNISITGNAATATNADLLDGYHADNFVKFYLANTDDLTRFTNSAFFQTSWISGIGDFGTLVIPTWIGNNNNNYYTTELRFPIGSLNPIIRHTHNDDTTDWKTIALVSDNVASASKWATPRTITLTGSVTGSVSLDGSANVTLATTTNHTHNYAGSSSAGGSADSAITLLYSNKFDTNYGDYAVFQQNYNRSDFPHLGWFNSIKMLHNNSYGYFTEIVTSFTGEDGMWRRALRNGAQIGWYKILDSGNYNSYCPKLDGTGATGTWGISITGNAGYASSAGYADSAGNANNLANIAAGNYFKHRDAVFNSEWSGKYLWTLWDNHLYAADKRLAVTLTGTTSTNFSSLFDGSFESSVSITEAKAVLHIKSTTEGNVWTEGLPYGDFYVVFYNSDAENITGRVYCNYAPQGTGWHDLAITHVGSCIWKLYNVYYQLSDLEITITKPVSSASIDLCQVLHVVERSPSPYYAAVMSKYCDQKTNYNIEAASFKKNGSSDSYVLLGGGGHKAISDFATTAWVNDNFYTYSESDNRYIRSETDPIWTADKVNYYTKTECDNKYQPKGAYLTEQNLQGYATTTWVNSNYYTCSESDSRYIQSETDPVWNAAKGNYYTKTECDNRYIRSETDPVWTAAKENYYTKTECDNKYQPKGTYLTEQNLQGYATQEWVRGEEYLYRSGGTMDARAEIGITTKLFIGNSTSPDTCYTKFNCVLHGGGDESNPNWIIRDNGYSEFKSSVSANAFYASSDIRLKNILDDINIDFDKLKLIPKKYYTWKGSDILQLGTIAQDIQKIYPEVVSKNENGYLSVDYSKLSIIALAAIDKLNERIKELECQIKL